MESGDGGISVNRQYTHLPFRRRRRRLENQGLLMMGFDQGMMAKSLTTTLVR